jgi:hypothetical protein
VLEGPVQKALEECGVPLKHSGMLDSLQWVHDRSEVEDWPTQLTTYAQIHGLKVPAFLAKKVPA